MYEIQMQDFKINLQSSRQPLIQTPHNPDIRNRSPE